MFIWVFAIPSYRKLFGHPMLLSPSLGRDGQFAPPTLIDFPVTSVYQLVTVPDPVRE